MAIGKLCYVVVVDDKARQRDGTDAGSRLPTSTNSSSSFRYIQSVLQSVLQLLGCKPHHAFKISRRVFQILERESVEAAIGLFRREFPSNDGRHALHMMLKDDNNRSSQSVLEEKGSVHLPAAKADTAFGQPKDGATVTVTREKFVDTIRQSLEKYHYVGPSQREDIILACRLREKKESVTILLCGTSGCGKSTLSSLLASRLGITTVVSTDSVRHMMRSFCSEKENPLLWASTYHAGECLDPVALAQAKARKKNIISSLQRSGELCLQGSEKKNDSQKYSLLKENLTEKQTADACISDKRHAHSLSAEQISSKELAVEGYKAQSEMVIDRLDSLITTWEDRKESVVVEGVHLSLNFVMGLMRKHPSVIPFLVYISNEEKHLERFAVRAKYMTLDPSKNKYVKYIRNIRTIQDYLCKRADKHLIPKVNNTNVDRSVASLHSTIFSCLRRRQMGTPFYDSATNTAKSVSDEYHKHNEPNAVGSKGMFRMIQRQDSLRRYMAVINDDGSINKAWPFLGSEAHLDTSSSGNDKVVGSPVYCPRNVCEIEHVHVQFGSFGLGSWPNDVEGSSCARSSNSSPTDIDEETSRYSSMASSPLHSNAHAKELVEEAAVSESEEEQFNEDDYSSDSTEKFEDDEIEGSVIESPAGSDEEYDENDDDAFHVNSQNSDGNNIKSFTRTLSIMPIKKIAAARGRLGRFKSMPLRRNCSIKRIKDKERQSSDD